MTEFSNFAGACWIFLMENWLIQDYCCVFFICLHLQSHEETNNVRRICSSHIYQNSSRAQFCNVSGFLLWVAFRYTNVQKHTKCDYLYHLAEGTISLLFPIPTFLSKIIAYLGLVLDSEVDGFGGIIFTEGTFEILSYFHAVLGYCNTIYYVQLQKYSIQIIHQNRPFIIQQWFHV